MIQNDSKYFITYFNTILLHKNKFENKSLKTKICIHEMISCLSHIIIQIIFFQLFVFIENILEEESCRDDNQSAVLSFFYMSGTLML